MFLKKRPDKPRKEEIHAKFLEARNFVDLGEFDKAFFLLSEVYNFIHELGETTELEVDALAEIGKLHWRKGAFSEAKKYLDEAIEKGTTLKYDQGIAYALNYRGNLEGDWINPKNAKKYYLEALEIQKRLNDVEGISTTFNNLGVLHEEVGEFSIAINYYNKSINLMRGIESKRALSGIAMSLNNIADIYTRLGQLEKAEPLHLEAQELCIKAGVLHNEAACVLSLGTLAWAKGKLHSAKVALEESLFKYQRLGINNRHYIKNLARLAGVHADLKEYGEAEKLLDIAHNAATALQSDFAWLYVHYHRGYLELVRGDTASAKKSLETCLSSAKKQKNFEFTLKCLIDLSNISLMYYRLTLEELFLEQTQSLIQELLNSAEDKNMPLVQAEAGIIQGMLLSAEMDYVAALEILARVIVLCQEKKLPKQGTRARVQIDKISRLKDRASRLIRPLDQNEQIEEIRDYLARYSRLLKGL